jgi:hypothetical protein
MESLHESSDDAVQWNLSLYISSVYSKNLHSVVVLRVYDAIKKKII